jgi:hypothetical protein
LNPAPWTVSDRVGPAARPAARVHWVSLSGLARLGWPGERLSKAMPLLAPSRRAKAMACRLPADRSRSLAAGILTAMVLGVRSDADLRPGPGRPELAAGRPSMSLSHSGDHVVLAVSDRVVGADVEIVAARGRALTERMLTAEERAALQASGDDPAVLTALWTRKESLAKADGRGLPLDRPIPVLGDVLPHGGRLWRVWTGALDGAVLSVAVEAGESPGPPDPPALLPAEIRAADWLAATLRDPPNP